jgi:hypothetical protein
VDNNTYINATTILLGHGYTMTGQVRSITPLRRISGSTVIYWPTHIPLIYTCTPLPV